MIAAPQTRTETETVIETEAKQKISFREADKQYGSDLQVDVIEKLIDGVDWGIRA